MDYGSVTSGIEAATVAWHPLGWRPKWFSEIAPFPCKLLKHHYPHVPNLGDMMALETNPIFLNESVNLLVGGTPCQSFSLAGLRGGLADARGNLALQYCRLLRLKKFRWFVWENVPGVFSSFSNETTGKDLEGIGPENGRDITETADFATLLAAFRECGYCCAWRVLDAQYFGVPQRRRRVFVVGYLGDDWRPPAAVLFESQSLCGYNKKGEKPGQEVAGTLDARTNGGGFPGSDGAMSGHIVGTLDGSYGRLQGASGQDANHGHSTLIAFGGNNTSGEIKVSTAVKGRNNDRDFESETLILDYPYNQITSTLNRSNPKPGDPSPTLTKTENAPLLIPHVRRLTPLECERLQGFPDYYTAIPGAKDSPRYEAIGNSMAVPVMRWIGARIDAVDKLLNPR